MSMIRTSNREQITAADRLPDQSQDRLPDRTAHRSRHDVAPGFGLSLVRALALLFLFGCAALVQAQFSGPGLGITTNVNRPTTITTDPAILYPTDRLLRLAPGDVVSIRLFAIVDYGVSARIDLDGTVQLPLIGVVRLEGLTIHQAEALIAKDLMDAGMYQNPEVIMQVAESPDRVITVIGEVHTVLPALSRRHLLDVLAGGGGLPPTASHIITILRPGLDEPIVVDLGTDPARSALANVPLFAGDTVVISRVGVVYVLGAFKTQGIIPIQGNTPLTLIQVTALSGGAAFTGKFEDLRIVRTVGTQRKVVRVDIKKIINGKAPDPVLQADDIVFLPTSQLKSIVTNGSIGTVLGIASIGVSLLYR